LGWQYTQSGFPAVLCVNISSVKANTERSTTLWYFSCGEDYFGFSEYIYERNEFGAFRFHALTIRAPEYDCKLLFFFIDTVFRHYAALAYSEASDGGGGSKHQSRTTEEDSAGMAVRLSWNVVTIDQKCFKG
jgi:hypothetical protein